MEVVTTEAMGVEELKAILEAKDGVLEEEEEIIYATDETEELEKADEIVETEEYIEIIEEIEYVDGDEDITDGQTIIETVDGDLIESTEDISQDTIVGPIAKKRAIDNDNLNFNQTNQPSQQIVSYDADGDWTLEEDPLEIPVTRAADKAEVRDVKKIVSGNVMNGNKGPTIKSDSGFRSVKRTSDYDSQDDNSPHEIVKNAENDLVYTVLGSKKHNESKLKADESHYIKVNY